MRPLVFIICMITIAAYSIGDQMEKEKYPVGIFIKEVAIGVTIATIFFIADRLMA